MSEQPEPLPGPGGDLPSAPPSPPAGGPSPEETGWPVWLNWLATAAGLAVIFGLAALAAGKL
jgi:hypothetical protein